MKKINLLLVISVILSLILIRGVNATFMYAENRASDFSTQITVGLRSFSYTSSTTTWIQSDILPTDEGENQQETVINIVEGTNGEGGLNDSESLINEYLLDRLFQGSAGYLVQRDHISSADPNYDFTELRSILGLDESVTFILQAVGGAGNSDYTTIYLFTTSVDLGEAGERDQNGNNPSNITPGSPNIEIRYGRVYPIYRTEITRENTESPWIIQETLVGSAPSQFYEEAFKKGATNGQIPSFAYDEWEEGELGGTLNDAIDSFVGDTRIIHMTPENNVMYLNFVVPASNGLHATITVNNENATMTLYEKNINTPVDYSTIIDGNCVIDTNVIVNNTWNYIVKITCDTSITVTIE